MLEINQLKIYQDLNEKQVIEYALNKYNIDKNDLLDIKIRKKSIDARKKDDVHYSYVIHLEVKNENKYKKLKHVEKIKSLEIKVRRNSIYQPVIIGSGPSGLFAAITLIDNGVKPIIIEQGQPVEIRTKDIDLFKTTRTINTTSNVQFGEGGAGTFSDGKLNTGINSPLVQKVLDIFYRFGAPKEITYLAKPHIGTDNLVKILVNIRNYIESNGGKYYFNTKFTDFEIENGLIKVVCDKQSFLTDALVLAIGHSSRDTYQLLKNKNFELRRKNFSVGVRIEHLQKDINLAQYGEKTDLELPSADYKLVYHGQNDRVCYSFCNCPGGEVIASSSDENSIVTNGMSEFKRDKNNCNSALLVNVMTTDLPGDDVLEGVKFQKELEHQAFILAGSNYNAPIQRVEDYHKNIISNHIGKVKPSYQPGYSFANLNELFPEYVNKTLKDGLKYFDTKIKGFNDSDAILTAVETRTSSPITILRDESMQSSIKNIYPIGEGAGYAGGITSSAVDGIKVAIKILEKEQ